MAGRNIRKLGIGIAAVAACGGVALTAGGSALAAPGADARPDRAKQAHITGDAWVRFSVDPANPNRRFVFDAHGAPYKVRADGKLQIGGAGYGTVKYFHPEKHGSSKGMWGSVKVDYVMTGGPVAVVSGVGVTGPNKGMRHSFSVYSDPRGRKYDRMGFSWGVVDMSCTQYDSAPAPFTSYVSGKGYTVKHAELPEIPAGTGNDDVVLPKPGCPNVRP